MQPYQEASQRFREQEERTKKRVKQGISLGASAASAVVGASLFSKAIPLLSEFIPAGLAIKGLSKLSPRLGKFIKETEKFGYGFDEVREFVKDKLESAEEKKPTSLFQQIVGDVDISTLDPNTQNQLGFLQMISARLEKQGKGLNDTAFKNLAKKIKKVLKGKSGVLMEEIGREGMQPNQPFPQSTEQQAPRAQGQQPGPGHQEIMEVLQRIQKTRGQR